MSGIVLNEYLGLDEEGILKLEKLAALGYSHKQMAMILEINVKLFEQNAKDKTSKINYHIERGILATLANEQLAIMAKAEKGEVDASKRLEEIRRNRSFQVTKRDIFGGFETKAAFEVLEEYINSGSSNKLSNDEAMYLEALTLMYHMDRKYGRRKTVEFFTKTPFNLKHQRAREMYDEAINLFYVDRKIEKKALRNKYAELLEEDAAFVRRIAETAKDMEIHAKIIALAGKFQELDKPDPEKLPAELYLPPVRMYSLDPADVKLERIDRNELGRHIDALDIPMSDILRLRQDAMIDRIDFKETLDELEKESQ